ncbi:MAG: hypothetical protein HYX89_08410 [Chloroflexi bacterium]|nr:hypothetical protein [Chloroflexota bacterium]
MTGAVKVGFATRLRSQVSILLVLLSLGGLLLTIPALGPVASEPQSLKTIPNTDVNPYGAHFFLQLEVEPWKVETTLQMAQDAGLGWVFQQFPWESLELKPGQYWNDTLNQSTWERYDQIVDLARQRGMALVARLDRPPTWTRQDNSLREGPPDDLQAYARFVSTVVNHFKGRIRYYQIWNEPNIFPEWGNRAVDPAAYVELLKVGYRAVKDADPNAYVLSAPLAQTLEASPKNMTEPAYLEEMYRAGAQPYFDILLANAYGFDRPPDDPADPQVLNFARFTMLRGIMARYGDEQKPVWLNEVGWNAAPASMPSQKLLWRRVDEQQQAAYTVRAIQMARQLWDWVGASGIWYFRQDGHYPPTEAAYYFRMVDVGLSPRLLYRAVQTATEEIGVAGPGAYQETNPALKAGEGWEGRIEPTASAQGTLFSQQPGATVTIKFRGGSISLLAAKGPSAGTLQVAVDGRAANRLPTNQESHSVLDMYQPTSTYEWITLADRLGAGEHTLTAVLSSERNPASLGSQAAIDAFAVGGANQRIPWPWVGGGLLTASLLLLFFRAALGQGGSR